MEAVLSSLFNLSMFRNRTLATSVVAGLIALVLLPSVGRCQNYQGNGAVLGGLGGAAAGAIIGDKSNKAGVGAAIGAGVGALSGLAIGSVMKNEVEKKQAIAAQQTAAAYEQRALQVRAGGVSPEDVISMARAGLSEDVISGQIRSSGIQRQMNVNDLIYLRNQGVPDGVIRTLQQTPVASAGTVNYNPTSYSAQVPTTTVIAAPAPPPVVIYEQPYYRPYYYGPGPYYHGYYGHGHHHHHHAHGTSFGITIR